MPNPFMYNRMIDRLEGKRAKVYLKKTSPYNGAVWTGTGAIPCLGTDANGEDIDGVTFNPDQGGGYILIEEDIEKIEFLD